MSKEDYTKIKNVWDVWGYKDKKKALQWYGANRCPFRSILRALHIVGKPDKED